jgi:hypothetical protein
VVDVRAEPIGAGHPDEDRRTVRKLSETLLALGERLVGAAPVDGERDSRRDRLSQSDFVLLELVRSPEVEHQLPDQPLTGDQRDEGHCTDSLVGEHVAQSGEGIIAAGFGNEHGMGPHRVGVPGRMAFHRAPVRLRETTRGLEPHHAVGIDEEDRTSVDAQRPLEAVERVLVDVFDRACSCDRLGHAVHGTELLQALPQGLLIRLAASDVGAHAHHQRRRTGGPADDRPPGQEPPHRAVAEHDSILHLVRLVVIEGALDLGQDPLDVVGMDVLSKCFEGPPEAPGSQPVDPLQGLGPPDAPVDDVPLPRTHVSRLKRQRETLSAEPELLEGLLVQALAHAIRTRGQSPESIERTSRRLLTTQRSVPRKRASESAARAYAQRGSVRGITTVPDVTGSDGPNNRRSKYRP